MSSVQALRDFINERLATAAGEIFSVFEQTIVQYEEEIEHQRKLLEISRKPRIAFHATEGPQRHAGPQKTSSGLQQEEHEAPPLKEEEDLVEVTVTDGERDDSLDSERVNARDWTTQRLTAAAVEIFTLFEETVVQHEEEVDRQRRLLEIIWKTEKKSHRTGNMLLKVKLGDVQKFVRITEPNLHHFLNAAFTKFGVPAASEGVKVVDGSGTEVDDDVFEDVVKDPSTGVLTITYEAERGSAVAFPESRRSSAESPDLNPAVPPGSPSRKRQRLDSQAMLLVESILAAKSAGGYIINEYKRTKSLTDESRRKMVNMLAADMTEKNGTSPARQVKEMYARGIVNLFPNLRDPFSNNGFEHYYDGDSGTGYLAWRIKTIQRCSAKDRRSSFGAEGPPGEDVSGGPAGRRVSHSVPEAVGGDDEFRDAMALMKHSADEDAVRMKMRMTFVRRRAMVLDPQRCGSLLAEFPRFRDVKGLVEQDFALLFGDDVSGRLLDKWPTTFKTKIVQQCRKLPSTHELQELLQAADPPEGGAAADVDLDGWDSDLSSILLLLHLIPPTALGRKRPGKVSASRAETHLVVFKQTGKSIQEHLAAVARGSGPHLLAVGARKNAVHQFFVVVDGTAVPCRSPSPLGAFDELFKTHFVFGTPYDATLHNMYTFVQTTVYNIDVGRVKESPRVVEVRARLLL